MIRIGIMAAVLAAIAGNSHGFCFEEAGREYDIAPLLLWGIAKNESGFNPRAVNRNTNGTYDFGVMQINSSWAATLGKERWNALADPCVNVRTGARILRQCIDAYGYNWTAVGCYNSRTPGKRERYAAKVVRILNNVPGVVATSGRQETGTPWEQIFGGRQ